MAHSKNSIITKTYSGKIGHICLQNDGVMRSLPDTSKRKWSEKQEQHLSRFQRAKEYGRQVVADPKRSEYYAGYLKRWKKKKKNIGIYQLAVMDFMHTPEIRKFQLDKGYGRSGSTIVVGVMDVFGVAGVFVRIVLPGGETVEEGEAAPMISGFRFGYVIRDPSLPRPGTILRVKAWDVPGNIIEKEFNFFL